MQVKRKAPKNKFSRLGKAEKTVAGSGFGKHSFDMDLISPIFFGLPTGVTIFIVVIVILLLFGGSKIPELARGLARARKEFKKATDEVEREFAESEEDAMRKEARRKIIEEEERAAIRARIEAEERAKADADKQ